MESFYSSDSTLSTEKPRRLFAIVEIIGGEIEFFPIADSDEQSRQIMDALRFMRKVSPS